MKYKEASWKTSGRKEGGKESLANQKAGTHPLGHYIPPTSSSWTPPPFSVQREHADSWLSLWWSLRGPESRKRGAEISYSRKGKAGRQASDLGKREAKSSPGCGAEVRQERRYLVCPEYLVWKRRDRRSGGNQRQTDRKTGNTWTEQGI